MPVLLLATSGPNAEIGLRLPSGALHVAPLISGSTRGRDVMPQIAGLLQGAELGPADLRGIFVEIGPGSFTGVRVGVTTAKTLAWSLGLPVVGVLSLDVLATADGGSNTGPLVAVRDAGRKRTYAARYESGRRVSEPARLDPKALRALSAGATQVGEDLEPPGRSVRTSAAALWEVGQPLLAAGETTPAHALVPRYLQASAPERLRDGEAPGDAS